jgi:glycosyltransferase involved in cell wall biosynthesis
LKKIIVSVTNDLSTDQRVHKICTSLTEEGHTVTLIGRKLKNSEPLERNYKTSRMRLLFTKGGLFYAEYNFRLFFKLLFLRKNILVSNDLDTLLPNYLIHKISKTKLVYDSHELFTEVPELIHRPKIQNIWLKIEEWIFPKLKNVITVCDSIATYYNNKYNVRVNVIKNTPVSKTVTIGTLPFPTNNKKIIIYQGAVNIGRGLETMIASMKFLEDCIFLVIGTGDIFNSLQKKVEKLNFNEKVKFLGKIAPDELKRITPLADLGISLEEDLGLNYRYALPNKIFDYIHASVPMIVSDLPEMKKVILENSIGKIIENRQPEKIAETISAIFKDEKQYFIWKSNLKKANKQYNWEKESEKLINIYTYLQ